MQKIILAILVMWASAWLCVGASPRYWTGAGGNAKASTAANWVSDLADPTSTGAPETGDAIILNAGSTAMTWDAGMADVEVASWTQDGYTGTVTFDIKYGTSGLTALVVAGDVVVNSGTWTHTANSGSETYRLNVTVGGSFTLGVGAAVDLNQKGYAGGKGPSIVGTYWGAGYGGEGDGYDKTPVTICYGSVSKPVNLGSGGSSGAGGGALLLTVGGVCTINGAVTSGSMASSTYYAGSGGSIWITAASLAGSGLISTKPGVTTTDFFGGGGRIALVLTGEDADFAAFTGRIIAYPSSKTADIPQAAGAGTIYYETAADGEGRGRVVVDRGSTAGTLVTPVTDIILDDQEANFNPKEIVVTNGATVRITGGVRKSFMVRDSITLCGTSQLVVKDADLDLSTASFACAGTGEKTVKLNGATLSSPDGMDIAGFNLQVDAVSTVTTEKLNVKSGGTLTVDKPLTVSGSVVVENGGVITHTVNTKESDYRVDLTVGGDMTINEGGKVTARNKGLPAKIGPGSGTVDWGAGCHGGRGYSYNADHDGVGVCYGSVTRPVELGSGTPNWALHGGGAIRLAVAGEFTNDGFVNANGDAHDVYSSSPAGSVWITCRSIAGSGRIEANAFGDDGLSTGALNVCCGGGRVAVWLTGANADFSSYKGTAVAYGARSSSLRAAGGAGTVYLKTGSQAANEGTLIIDNAVPTGYLCWPTEIGSQVTDTVVGSVIVRNGGLLKILAGQSLTVMGDLDASPNFLVTEDGGEIAFAGAGVSHIYSNLTVSAFACRTPGKEIVFADGASLAITENGRLQIEGDDGHEVILRSETAAAAWNLNLDATVAQSVSRVAVSDCDASAGAQVSAVNSTLMRTTNWKNTQVVVGQVVTWTGGAKSDSWAAAGNWDVERAPLATDRVVIAPATVSPVLADDVAMMDLTVQDGASLNLGGRTLTVTDNATVAGRILSARGGKLVANGAASFAGAQIDTPYLELVLAGDGDAVQMFDGGSADFHCVTILPQAAGVTVTGGFLTDYLACETDGAFAISFVPGITVSVDALLTLTGEGLTLGSTVPGQTYELAVKGVKNVSGATASDNTGYTFAAPVVWTGAVGSDFNTAGNWNGGRVPGENDDVVIGAGTVKASAAVAVGTLKLESGANVAIDAGVSVAGTLYLTTGALLTHSDNTSSSAYTLNLAIGGDLVIEDGAFVDVSGKGKPSGSGVVKTPTNCGGTYGGRGECWEAGRTDNSTYGSILSPCDLGSGGSYPSAPGAGAVGAAVAGEAWIDGMVKAKGGGGGSYCVGSGGSINLTTAALFGEGEISANGGDFMNDYSGGGGRIAVKLTRTGATHEDFLGSIQAYSGSKLETVPYPRGSAGTVYLETAADGAGRGQVVIDNSETGLARSSPGQPLTDYPVLSKSPDPKEAANATFVLRNTVGLNIVSNTTIGNLIVEGTKPKIYLNGYTLKVKSPRPKDWPKDGLPSFVIQGEDANGNPGQIIWKQGFALIVR